MSPEELAEAKRIVAQHPLGTWKTATPPEMEYVALLPRILKNLEDAYEATPACNVLLKQIEALKAGWVAERISGEYSDWIENQCQHWDIDDQDPFCSELDGPCEYREGKCPIRNELRDRARRQLATEHPDLFQDNPEKVADSEKEALP